LLASLPLLPPLLLPAAIAAGGCGIAAATPMPGSSGGSMICSPSKSSSCASRSVAPSGCITLRALRLVNEDSTASEKQQQQQQQQQHVSSAVLAPAS
jgi:hypothetical protein